MKQITIKDDEEIVEVDIKKTGKVEIAAEDKTYSRKVNDRYTSHYTSTTRSIMVPVESS